MLNHNFVLILILSGLISCNGQSDKKGQEVATSDTVVRPVTVTDLRKARPVFPGYREQRLDINDSVRYLRIVLNNNILVKTWMVYFDRPKHKWITLTWSGKGGNNMILLDTVFLEPVGIMNNYDDSPGFYFASSDDEGTTWKPLDMSLASLADCKRSNMKKLKMAQLVVSNDFLNAEHTPSVTYVWQWDYNVNFMGQGIASQMKFSALCPVVQEISWRNPK